MTKVMSLTMCLMLPMTAFAQDALVQPAPAAAPAAAAPLADPPAQSSLVPADAAAPAGATEGTRACGMGYGKCGGAKGKGKGKWIVITGVVGVVLTAAAIGIAVGVAKQSNAGQVPR